LDPLGQDVLGTDQYIAQEALDISTFLIAFYIFLLILVITWHQDIIEVDIYIYFDINENRYKGKGLERGSKCFCFLEGL